MQEVVDTFTLEWLGTYLSDVHRIIAVTFKGLREGTYVVRITVDYPARDVKMPIVQTIQLTPPT